MGYYKGLVDSYFRKSSEGNLIFYPYGKFGSGYIIIDDDQIKIKKFLNRYLKISFPLILLSVFLFGIYAFVLLFIFILFYSIKIKNLLANAKRTREKIKIKEILRNMAVSMGIPTSIFMLIASILMVGGSAFVLFYRNEKLIGILGLLFFGIGLCQSAFLVKYSIEQTRDKER
jgi:hypothetical protein